MARCRVCGHTIPTREAASASPKTEPKSPEAILVVRRDEDGVPWVEAVATAEEAGDCERLSVKRTYEGFLRQIHLVPRVFHEVAIKKKQESTNLGLLHKWMSQQNVVVAPSEKNPLKWFVFYRQGQPEPYYSNYLAAVSGDDNVGLNVHKEK